MNSKKTSRPFGKGLCTKFSIMAFIFFMQAELYLIMNLAQGGASRR